MKKRKALRMKGFDYSSNGIYFITISVKGNQSLLGEVVDGAMVLNDIGLIAQKWWKWLESHYEYVYLHDFVVMPNHFHGMLQIKRDLAIDIKVKTLGSLIGAFKTVSTKEINQLNDSLGERFWHRNYYEYVIRNEKAYKNISKYIKRNPENWKKDKYNRNKNQGFIIIS